MFGDRVGDLYRLMPVVDVVVGATAETVVVFPHVWLVRVRASASLNYIMIAAGMSEASFIKMAAAVEGCPSSEARLSHPLE